MFFGMPKYVSQHTVKKMNSRKLPETNKWLF
jgi:hypothetical protein